MKIIFDSEEQKKNYFDANAVCPHDIGFDDPKDSNCFKCKKQSIECERCWKAAGIKVKVKPQIDDDVI
jgi:hypothetical protein